jgi:hypothetical protein
MWNQVKTNQCEEENQTSQTCQFSQEASSTEGMYL